MPEQLTIVDFVSFAVIGLALVVVGVMLFAGALREKALNLGPTRDLDMPQAGYVIGAVGVIGYVALNLTVGGMDDKDDGYQAAQTALFLLPFGLIGLMIGRAVRADAGLRTIGLVPRWPKRDCIWGIASLPVCYGLGLAATLVMVLSLGIEVDEAAHETLRKLQEDFSPGLLIQVIVFAVIVAPLMEEVLFRGVLQTSLMRLFGGRRWPAVLIAAALFSVTHWWVVDWYSLPSLFVLGVVWGYLYERTGSLLTPILAHAAFNAANIAIAVLQL